MFPRNTLFYGDNLQWLRDRNRFPDACVDLVYLDPPFNSNRSYNILFKDRAGAESAAQVRAFEDSWEWGHDSQETYVDLTQRGFAPGPVQELVLALRRLLGTNDLFAYLVMMTARLVELHRVLKPTGSLYLHCDPTASHYLKIVLDAVFGPRNFRNEIIWKRTTAHSSSKKFAPVHDTLLYYSKSSHWTWNEPRTDYDEAYLNKYYRFDDGDGRRYWRADICAAGIRHGRSGAPWRGIDPSAKGMHWKFAVERLDELDNEGRIYWPKNGVMPQYKRYRDELKGKAVADIWDDVSRINPVGNERLGFPTQKPVALLSRVIAASSNPGDVVLDAFCGCGTTIDAAQRLGRQWVGIDVTILAIDLIRKRIAATFGPEVANAIDLLGVPNEPAAARDLFEKDPFEFERWLVTLVDGQPNERPKQSGDRGIDGVIRFPAALSGDGHIQDVGRSLISVKGGRQLNPAMVRDLRGTVEREGAEMGLLLTLNSPTAGMRAEAEAAGPYVWPWNNRRFQKLQIASVDDLLGNRKPEMPTPIPPYSRAQRLRIEAGQLSLF